MHVCRAARIDPLHTVQDHGPDKPVQHLEERIRRVLCADVCILPPFFVQTLTPMAMKKKTKKRNFMAAVAARDKELYPEGLADEIVLWYSEITLRLHHAIPSEMHP